MAVHGVDCALGTSLGLQREENEDRALLYRGSLLDGQPYLLMAVADGMGGMVSGAECARRTLAGFATAFQGSEVRDLEKRLLQAILEANDNVFGEFGGRGGATISAILIVKNGATLAVNVGDSRIYSFDRENGEAVCLTEDDTIEAHVARLENRAPPADSDFIGSQLLQFVGIGGAIHPHIIPIPSERLAKGLLITSDGAHRCPHSVFEALAEHASSARELVTRLLSFADWIGGYDNATAAAIFPDAISKFLAARSARLSFASVWTPLGQLEFVAVKPTAPVARDCIERRPADDRSAPIKKARLRKHVKKAKPTTSIKPETDARPSEENQISIEFIDDGEPK